MESSVDLYWLLSVGGMAVGILVTLTVGLLRKAYVRRRIRRMFENGPVIRKFQKKSQTQVLGEIENKVPVRSPDTKKRLQEKKAMEERETKLSEILSEMRELILRLTDIVAKTDNATGEASERFNSAKKALENLSYGSDDVDLKQIRVVLLSEVDKMVKSNAYLKKQLDNAQKGMNDQKLVIDQLKTKANVDNLTQLNNRAAFDEALQNLHANWRHFRDVFSLLMLDVDHFKQINDTHGHVHGDRILFEIAGKIKDAIRDKDFAARYGGEEFSVILPNTPAEEALVVGTRIRESIERSHFQVDGNPLHMTISGGIAQSRFGWTPVAIIDVADKALYQSKKRGRNRITLGEDSIKESWTSNEGR